MRIIAGTHKGRVLTAAKGSAIRPTSDRARESLFNILDHGDPTTTGVDFTGHTVVDACAGTGALGLEALSRGAGHAFFIEQSPTSLAVLSQNIAHLGEESRSTVLREDVTRVRPAPRAALLVFLDPPYFKDLALPALAALRNGGWFVPDGLCIVETATKESIDWPSWAILHDTRSYGAAKLWFLRVSL